MSGRGVRGVPAVAARARAQADRVPRSALRRRRCTRPVASSPSSSARTSDDLVFSPNATSALNAVIRSLRIRPEEEILTTKHEYGAIVRTLGFIRANVVLVEPEELIANIGIRTRAIVVSHITSPTALVLPVEEICDAARKAGVLSIVDGAHVPGHIPLDVGSLGADVYAGNCHKWLCAPKGAGFLWSRPEHQDWIEPLVISWGYHEDAGFGERHGWQGTRDPAACLAVPKAIEAHASFDLAAAKDLADEAERRLSPFGAKPHPRRAIAAHARAHGAERRDPAELQRRLYDEHRVEVPVYEWEDTTLMRVSIGPYNDEADVERLVDAVRTDSRAVIQAAIQKLLDGHDLGRDEAREVMGEIMGGEATPAQIGGFLVALRAKGETADEIAGCAEAMRAHVLEVRPSRDDVVDVVGTGGDGGRTFNISTTAAIVAAAAGAAVAKHGNRAVSSVSGSADVLEALGFTLEQPPERIAESIDTLGFGFMFAPLHHPAMRHAAPVRRELGTRTIFNILGPLTNPAGARAGVFGVYSPEVARTVADALAVLDSRRAFVVHGAGGIDELSPAGPNLVFEVADGAVRERVIDPLELGIESLRPGGPRRGHARGERRDGPRGAGRGARGEARRRRAQRRRRDRGGRSRRGSRRRPRGRRRPRSTAAPRSPDWRSSWRSRENPADGTLRGRARRAGTDGDRRGQAPLAVGGRPSPGRRSGRAGRSLRACRRRGGLDPRRRALRRHLGRSPCGSRVRGAAAPREGVLLERGRLADRPRCRRRRSAPTPPRSRRRAGSRAARHGGATRSGDARRGARCGGAGAGGGARCSGDRDQRAGPRDVPHRSRRAARARRGSAARSDRRSPRAASSRAPRAPPPSWRERTRSSSAPRSCVPRTRARSSPSSSRVRS